MPVLIGSGSNSGAGGSGNVRVGNASDGDGLSSVAWQPGDLMIVVVTYLDGTPRNAPAGWTTLSATNSNSGTNNPTNTIAWRRLQAGDTWWTFLGDGWQNKAAWSVYRDAGTPYGGVRTQGDSMSPWTGSVTTTGPNHTVVRMLGSQNAPIHWSSPCTERADTWEDWGGTPVATIADQAMPSAGASGVRYTTGPTANSRFNGYAVAIPTGNNPPNAPSLTTLTGGEVIDRAAVNRASHSFSDPNPGDSQSAFDHRYRLVGSSTWTTAYVATPNGFVDYPAGTFTAGDYERQVRTYDSQGEVGDWSASGFFTAADAPAAPTITDPIQNETVSANSRDVSWSAPAQDAYQLQVLDGGLVEHDTGTVVTTQRTAYGVPFPTNNVSRSIRVRVRSAGLWSAWYTISVAVSYTPPPTPAVTLQASGTAIVVQITNPAPGAGEPTVVQNDVFVTEDGQEQRRAIVTPNGSWTYWLPASGVAYDQLVRVEAIGDNGTRSSS